jgi:hypothetical protein
MKELSSKFRSAAISAAIGGAALIGAAAPALADSTTVCRDRFDAYGNYRGQQCRTYETAPQPRYVPTPNPGIQAFGMILHEIERQQRHDQYRNHHRPHFHHF